MHDWANIKPQLAISQAHEMGMSATDEAEQRGDSQYPPRRCVVGPEEPGVDSGAGRSNGSRKVIDR